MKILFLILCAFFIAACSQNIKQQQSQQSPQSPQPAQPANADPAIIEKNKQTAVLNQVGKVTSEAQYLEKLGRDMEVYRAADDSQARRNCAGLSEMRMHDIADLDAKIKSLPDNYSARITPIIADLKPCVSCARKAIDGCIKTRAELNRMIKETYPQ